MKKLLALILSLSLSVLVLFSGCSLFKGAAGRDGVDGADVSIYEIYEAVKTETDRPDLSFDDFLKEYLSYTNAELAEYADIQKVINKSLLSGVSILTRFTYSSSASLYTGSGVIIDLDKENGNAYVVTNCHVIYDYEADDPICEDIRLYLYGQDIYGVNYSIVGTNITGDRAYRIPATVVGASVDYDIAVLKVENSEVLKRSDAEAASFSTAEHAYVGETVYTVGNASGEGVSVSKGIISKDSEYISVQVGSEPSTYRVIRTDAAVNHGNSGGGLFNKKGEIVGIVNAKDDEVDVDNMGYVLPSSSVRRLVDLMLSGDSATAKPSNAVTGGKKAMLGIETSVDDSYAKYNTQTGLVDIYETVTVASVSFGSAAYNKLAQNDEIKAIKVTSSDGTVKEDVTVTRGYNINDVMLSVRSGDTVTLTVIRNSKEQDVSITYNYSSIIPTAYFSAFS